MTSGRRLSMMDQLIAKKGVYETEGTALFYRRLRSWFPVRPPAYDTAFVFLKEDYSDADVPPWAIKLILDPEDLEEMEDGGR